MPAHELGPAPELVVLGETRAIPVARQWAEGRLAACGFDGMLGDALLVVSELVTNAVVHGGGMVTVRLRPTASGVRIEVADSGAGEPEVREAPPEGELRAGGYGLLIVDALSDRWGVEREGTAKTVWAHVPRHRIREDV